MTTGTFRLLLVLWAALFALLFVVIVIPPLIGDPDLLAAISAGFVNPYATGYSLDTIMCWVVLTTWVAYEAKARPGKTRLDRAAAGAGARRRHRLRRLPAVAAQFRHR